MKDVVGKEQRVAAGCEGDGVRGVVTAGEDVTAHRDVAVATVRFVSREIEFRILLVIASDEGASSTTRIVFALGCVVDEDVVRQHKVSRLIDPRPSSAIAKRVADDSHVFAGLLNADHPRAVGAIDSVAGNDRVATELGQKERTHPRAGDVIAIEDDVLAFLYVHRVAECTEPTASHDHSFAAHKVQCALSGPASRRCVKSKVSVKQRIHQLRIWPGVAGEPDRCAARFVRDADKFRVTLHDKILPASDNVRRKIIIIETQRLLSPIVPLRHGERFRIVEVDAVVTLLHSQRSANVFQWKVFCGERPFGFVVIFWPDGDLPEISTDDLGN